MKKHYPSKLDPFAEQLDHWFGVENMPLAQARDRLRELGCGVSRNNLSHWCRVRRQRQWQEQLLHDISSGAQQCGQAEKEFAQAAAPDVETLLKPHRVLLLQLSTQASADPPLIQLVNQSMRPGAGTRPAPVAREARRPPGPPGGGAGGETQAGEGGEGQDR